MWKSGYFKDLFVHNILCIRHSHISSFISQNNMVSSADLCTQLPALTSSNGQCPAHLMCALQTYVTSTVWQVNISWGSCSQAGSAGGAWPVGATKSWHVYVSCHNLKWGSTSTLNESYRPLSLQRWISTFLMLFVLTAEVRWEESCNMSMRTVNLNIKQNIYICVLLIIR